jgi:hypothetical protein
MSSQIFRIQSIILGDLFLATSSFGHYQLNHDPAEAPSYAEGHCYYLLTHNLEAN